MRNRRGRRPKGRSRRNRRNHRAASAPVKRGDQRRGNRKVGGGLDDLQAAGDIEIDVMAPSCTPQRASSTASTMDSRSDPSRRPRGAACRAARARPEPGSRPAAAACLRCRRKPRRPARRASRSLRNRAEGFGTSRRPAAVISNTPISSVGPKRFLTARRRRNGGRRRPRNRAPRRPCARSPCGPAIWPSLVTWPTSSSAAPLALAKRISACARRRAPG